MSNPAVSVLAASYNHRRFLDEMVASVLGQTHRDFELVVVDDGSSDGSLDHLLALARTDERMRVLQHPDRANHGLATTRQRGLEACRGDFVCFIDSDDYMEADKIEHQLARLRETGRPFTYGRIREVDEAGSAIDGRTFGTHWREVMPTPFEAMLRRNYLGVSSVLVLRRAIEEVGGFNVAGGYEDQDLWLRLFAVIEPDYSDRVVASYRILGDSIARNAVRSGTEFHHRVQAVEHLEQWPGLPIEHVELVASWRRCHLAMLELLDPVGRELALGDADAPRLALLLDDRLARIARAVGRDEARARLDALARRFPAVGPVVEGRIPDGRPPTLRSRLRSVAGRARRR